MSEKILTTMHGAMRTDDENTDGYYVLQWTSGQYTLKEDKEMENYTPTITVDAGEIVYDAVFLNPVYKTKYWHAPTKIGVEYITVRLKQVLLPNITMIKIYKINTLLKRCKKKEATKLGTTKTSNEDIYGL